MSDKKNGNCLCGAVKFAAEIPNLEVGTCHCGMCRRWSGGIFLAVGFKGDIEIDDDSNLNFFHSSDWGERGFCNKCGSNLFWRTQDKSHGVVSVQALEEADEATLSSEIFIDKKPDYYSFSQETKQMSEAQVMAIFAPAEGGEQ